MTTQNDTDQDAYREEQEKLADVIRSMQSRIADIKTSLPARAGDTRTADIVQEMLAKELANLEFALPNPYYGRIDYQQLDPREANSKTIYVGENRIAGTDVISWTAPVARLWYLNENDSKYRAPYGEIHVRVDLRRFLRIRSQNLTELHDMYRRALPACGVTSPNPALAAALSGTGTSDGHLSVIIETIEPEQYESIANVTDQVLVVQGAAGSGKSEIGFHRIAFLLSPFNELPERERPAPDTTIFIGPSNSFLEYAADILPASVFAKTSDRLPSGSG